MTRLTLKNLIKSAQMATLSPQTHKVAPGDALSRVARRYGTTVGEISRLNGVKNPNMIRPGQVLKLPHPPGLPQKPTIPTQNSPKMPQIAPKTPLTALKQPAQSPLLPGQYRVGKGDTLSGIAQRQQVSWPALAKVNGLSSPYAIRPGQTLEMPPAATVQGRVNSISEYLHAKMNNPNAEKALLANINHETGGTFSHTQRERGGGGGHGIPQYTGDTLKAYDNWLATSKRVDSPHSQIDYFVDSYMPKRRGYSTYMARGANYTPEQYAAWMHRHVFTPAHHIPGNANYSATAIASRNAAQNAFMSNRLDRVGNVWRYRQP